MLRRHRAAFSAEGQAVIYLHMVGGPSQLDLFDYKPKLGEWFDKDLPDSVRMGQRITTMTSGQKRLPIAPSKYKFAQYGKSGMWVSELLPWTAKMVDDLCFIRSMNTDAINHEPAITFMQTGNQITGKPCLGSWVSYGLGSLNENLPTFVVLVAKSTNTEQLQAIGAGCGRRAICRANMRAFPSARRAIRFCSSTIPQGVDEKVRRKTLDGLKALNEINFRTVGDPETHTRIQQYELAFRMQASVPELARSLARVGGHLRALRRRGEEARHVCEHGGARAAARRTRRALRADLSQQLGHALERQRPSARPVQGRGSGVLRLDPGFETARLLDDTLVVWGGEFGRTIYSQGELTKDNYGRDHHPRCYTMWMAGGGAKPGVVYGETDDFSYNIVKDPVHVHDFHATALKLLGFDHLRFTYRFQGLDQRLTGVVPANVVDQLIA